MLAVFVERARAFKDLLVLLVVVALGARFINGGDDVVWSVAEILTLLAGHGHCHDGDCVRHSGGCCGVGHRGGHRSSEVGDGCPHPC